MPIEYPDILQQKTLPRHFSYVEKDVILYSLAVGLGADPMDDRELSFVTEQSLRPMPTAVTVLANSARSSLPQWILPEGMKVSKLNYSGLLHGGQKVTLHKPTPTRGHFQITSRTLAAYDKGVSKGAVIVSETYWTDDAGELAVTLQGTTFARDDGGFGGPAEGAPAPHPTPDRPPDISVEMPTWASQALLYRLNGDWNPLHSDPDVARRAGFPRPILHGLCTFGLTCHAVLKCTLNYDVDRIFSHEARFSSPVFPGETLTVDMWREAGAIDFRARVASRNVLVVRNGRTVLR